MAFGISRKELNDWKKRVREGEIAFLTHYWYDPRFPAYTTVTKVGCADIDQLVLWGKKYGLKQEWIHESGSFPHFDLLGEKQKEILQKEGVTSHIERFRLK